MAILFRYSVSRVTQGKNRFYTLTMPSRVLASTCFISRREEDPKIGFQRVLDRSRAQDIANYIDQGGVIPSSIVLSAQPDALAKIVGQGKTLEFKRDPKAFLVLDGQHRVYGFQLAKKETRVPVVVFIDLTRQEETRLFIDINTKQRPVPNELLLDIKKQADYETEVESTLGEIFETFNEDEDSPLFGLLSPYERRKGKISRVTFYAALKPLLRVFVGSESAQIYDAISAYLRAFIDGCNSRKAQGVITIPTVFRGAMLLFPEVGQRVKDRFDGQYSARNFSAV
jgi:DGQHR domain-containing protein